MWAEKSWTFQSSRLKERGKLQKSPGGTETPQGSQAWDAAVRRAKESCPLPIGFKSSTDQVSKESALWLLVQMAWKQTPALAAPIQLEERYLL